VNNELEKFGRRLLWPNFKVLSQHSPVGTEKTMKKIISYQNLLSFPYSFLASENYAKETHRFRQISIYRCMTNAMFIR
jgi:hypothetical protein